MRKRLLFALVAALLTSPILADSWSIGAHTGPFIFGDFYTRSGRFITETGSADATITVSAKTRAGASVDIEREFARRFAIRAQATFTEAPMTVETGSGSGISFSKSTLDATTLALPLVFRINPNGAFRFHIAAGPAYARYDIHSRATGQSIFQGSRDRWGAIGEAGVAWWLGRSIAIEGAVADIVTSSPFQRSDFSPTTRRLDIPKPHNVHTTVGIRYRF